MSDVGCNEPLKVKDKYVYLDVIHRRFKWRSLIVHFLRTPSERQ